MRLARRAAAGNLVRLLPGVYCPVGARESVHVRVAAVAAADPDAVITHRAAAALDWWDSLPVPTVTATRRSRVRRQQGYRWARRTIPPELIRDAGGIRRTTPALTVLDLIPELGGQVVDEALRRGVVTLADLWHALELTPNRRGNKYRRLVLTDSRDEPWSEAERELHRVLRSLPLPERFRTNLRVQLHGRVAYLDAALPGLLLGIEVDGYEFHGTRERFEGDRRRDLELEAAGWHIVRISAAMILHDAKAVADLLLAVIERRLEALATGSGAATRRS